MSQLAPLNAERHGKLKLRDRQDYQAYAGQHLVPVVFQEFYGLATEFPLVFVRNSEAGDFVPVAMMGLKQGINLYCQTSDWRAGFIPVGFTVGPLLVTRLESESEPAEISLNEDSELLDESLGEPLFTDSGEQTEFLQKRIEKVMNVTRQTLQARALCKFLADQNLLKQRQIRLQYSPDSPRYEVEGVYIIDEEKLESLSDQEFLTLRQRGLIPLIYAHLTSLQQFGRLSRLQAEADKAAIAQTA